MDIFQKLLIQMIGLNSTQKSFIYASAQYVMAKRNQSTILPTSNIYLCDSKRRCLCLLNTFSLFILNSVTCKDAWTPSSLYVSNVLRYKHIRRKDHTNWFVLFQCLTKTNHLQTRMQERKWETSISLFAPNLTTNERPRTKRRTSCPLLLIVQIQ